MRRTCRCQAQAFTLVEMLVVLVMVALLLALVSPVLSKSRASAQRIACVNHLRQLGLAAQMYWDDNAGAAFRWRGPSTNNGQIYWFGWLENGTEGKRKFDARPGALFPYVSGRGPETCPSFNYANHSIKLKATGASYGYGYNLALSAAANEPPVNVTKIAKPSELVLLADAAQVNTFQPPASPDRPMLEEFYYVSTNEATAHFRHQHTANAVFCDGHVAREKPVAGSIDQRLPREMVGKLRTGVLAISHSER